jgi:hypothetical protein
LHNRNLTQKWIPSFSHPLSASFPKI